MNSQWSYLWRSCSDQSLRSSKEGIKTCFGPLGENVNEMILYKNYRCNSKSDTPKALCVGMCAQGEKSLDNKPVRMFFVFKSCTDGVHICARTHMHIHVHTQQIFSWQASCCLHAKCHVREIRDPNMEIYAGKRTKTQSDRRKTGGRWCLCLCRESNQPISQLILFPLRR